MTAFLLLAACAVEDHQPAALDAALGEAEPAEVLFGEVQDLDPETDGPLLAQLIEERLGEELSYPSVLAVVPVAASGLFTIELPELGTEYGRYRLLVRERLGDGTPGAILTAWQPAVVYDADGDVARPAGWSFEVTRAGQVFTTEVDDVSIPLRLRPAAELVVGGPFVVPEVATDAESDVRVALMADGEPVEGAIGAVAAGVWGMRLDASIEVPDGALLRPVAFVDVDGDLAYDPDSEPELGVGCARGAEAFVRKFAAPVDVPVADWMTRARAVPGWNAWAAGGPEGHRLFDASRMVIDAACE